MSSGVTLTRSEVQCPTIQTIPLRVRDDGNRVPLRTRHFGVRKDVADLLVPPAHAERVNPVPLPPVSERKGARGNGVGVQPHLKSSPLGPQFWGSRKEKRVGTRAHRPVCTRQGRRAWDKQVGSDVGQRGRDVRQCERQRFVRDADGAEGVGQVQQGRFRGRIGDGAARLFNVLVGDAFPRAAQTDDCPPQDVTQQGWVQPRQRRSVQNKAEDIALVRGLRQRRVCLRLQIV